MELTSSRTGKKLKIVPSFKVVRNEAVDMSCVVEKLEFDGNKVKLKLANDAKVTVGATIQDENDNILGTYEDIAWRSMKAWIAMCEDWSKLVC